ncbi:hypothetical protein [Pseudodesulfovibrio senegalensis]|uniref:Uncharacterized protein n=1 Tax=Pseudodesulfovibrio senegalensis TaxID=1721087 RepID=A0A6N6N4T9_9BACT|nr:hypothetical protein [Pseudodesulfovibrio senegalensis]KAB1443084.1 hypothetical protein F8A88_02125 [Pseudodesulfovibrio senegalensis]
MKLFNIEITEDVGFALILLAMMSPFIVGFIAYKWDGHFFPQENCWKVQEVNGRIFKVNTCNGEVEEIKEADANNATKK